MGGGKDGLIVETRDACKGGADPDELEALIDRTNRARRQLWRWMHERRAGVAASDLQREWREAHLRGVVCGGWVEDKDGKWQEKTC